MMTNQGDWIPAVGVDDLPIGGRKLFRHYDKRIAVFRTEREIYAIDNRCPHQGYALLQGDVKEETLTCAWHNWKFELDEGGFCSFGGESVRTYPVEVRGGQVFVDVTDPAAEVIAPQLFESLLEAMGEVDIGRLARDTMRLRQIGTPLIEVVREGVNFGAPRMEYGWNHSLATLTDCLNLAAMFEGELQAFPVIQGMSVVSQNEVRRPIRPRPDPVDPVEVYGSVEEALLAYPHLVNDEQSDQAEALLRGLLASGVAPDKVRHALLSAITDHFLGYGHPMIFAHKSFELLDKIGWEEADTVLSPLVPNMVLSTRYDRLPYMRKFLKAWEAADVDLDAIVAKQNSGPFDAEGFRRAVLDGDPQTSFAALNGALEAGVDVGKILNVTSAAAAERFRRFDIDIDTDDTNEWGWLDVTHNMTYLDALRWAWSVDPSPEVLRGLYHAVWFVNFTRRFDERNPRVRQEPAVTSDADSIVTAIRNKDPEGAEALIAGYEGPAEELRGAIARGASEDNSIAPIMVAHAVKTARASIIESEAIGDRSPMIAAGRFMASPKRERFVYNATLEAIAFTAGRSRGEGE
ncbi:MAG: Rieske 2Fe-2S domain-containing protein [Acidobacteria bacterium]|nr:Rieske 2Fe-2S domain-containing protein [Acidobacteriota bacterium]